MIIERYANVINRSLQKVIAGIFLLAILWCWPGSIAFGASSYEFYYFNPDSLQSNLGRLKRAMETFLSAAPQEIEFQPFAHLVDFQQNVREKHPAFLFVPHWFLQHYGRELSLRPLLIPVRNGSTFYRKVLLAGQGMKAGESLKDKSLAMTTMGPSGGSILKNLFADQGLKIAHLSPVVVPKDPDALFALALGQVDLALVTQENLKQIGAINPNILQAVRPLLVSAPIPMPVLCYAEDRVDEPEALRLREFFRGAAKNKEISSMMEILEIDDWQTVPE